MGARASASAHASGDSPHASASASVDSVAGITHATIEALIEEKPYVLICVTNAGVADRGTMNALAAHFHELTSSDSGEYRQWSTALLDYHAEASARENRSARMAALLPML